MIFYFLRIAMTVLSSPKSLKDKLKNSKYTGFLLLSLLLVSCATFWQLSGSDGSGYLIVIALGAAVGCVELLGRYMYAPVRAVMTGSGISYIIINMAAAAAAYYMIGPQGFDVFKSSTETTGTKDLYRILTAGFGALVFMRSSIFKVRVGDGDIGIGPVAILDTLLMVADRGVDRHEAVLRAQEVTNLLRGADPQRGAQLLAAYCLALMQNVSIEDQTKIKDLVRKVTSDTDIETGIKLDLVALQLSNLVGPTVLQAAIEALGERLNPTRQSGIALLNEPRQQPDIPRPTPIDSLQLSVTDIQAELAKASSNKDIKPNP
jgi:uncharacterized membrane protein YjjP (DUF1212 family)